MYTVDEESNVVELHACTALLCREFLATPISEISLHGGWNREGAVAKRDGTASCTEYSTSAHAVTEQIFSTVFYRLMRQ